MTTIASIASRILQENSYSTSDITTTVLEYKIQDAIDYIELQAGITIADLAGAAGTKSITATDPQILVVKWLTNLFIRAYENKGTNISIAGISLAEVITDPDFQVTMKVIDQSIERLKSAEGIAFAIGQDTEDIEE